MQKTQEEMENYGLNLLSLASETKKLSMDDNAALSPALSHITVSSAASSESQAPSFTESSPPSEKSAELNGGSKNTSRGSSVDEHTPASLTVSVHAIDDAIISHAELVSSVHECPQLTLLKTLGRAQIRLSQDQPDSCSRRLVQ